MMKLEDAKAELGLHGPCPGWAAGEAAHGGHGPEFRALAPWDGAVLTAGRHADAAQVDAALAAAEAAFRAWRRVPAPRRGAVVRALGERLRRHQGALACLITHEVGKIPAEAMGEVQEGVDICEFAVGLSRQLHGLTIASERPGHRLDERWHPLGPVGCLTAFNFPAAVWAWNAALAVVCGDSVVWKPSEKAPLTAWACHRLAAEAALEAGAPPGLFTLVVGGPEVGAALVADRRLPLVSATGSTRMGRAVGEACARRFARALLELGGNNAAIVAPSADLDLAVRAIVFGAAGTAGQRCTTLRRLVVHASVANPLLERLRLAYAALPVGDPRVQGTLVGPLIDDHAVAAFRAALAEARAAGAAVLGGDSLGGRLVRPALVEGLAPDHPCVQRETFGPILYVLPYEGGLEEALAIQNGVPQGLSSCIFTRELADADAFCGPAGSDCGIANVNVGTSGAEIGGAFGGEKETGGGRESGSDAWKAYMRRSTQTVNHTGELPLAQGIRFEV